jgi:hypothetical protein
MPFYDSNGNMVNEDGSPFSPGYGPPQGPDSWRRQPGYQGPGSQYGEPRDQGWTWGPGAAEKFSQDNRIDPNTGQIQGPGGLVPHQLALQYQAQHDQAVWNFQQSQMRSGMAYARGALGLLQSFRPGGGATLEAGQYNQLAGLSFQRAQLTQPMDLMGDWRREQAHLAQSKANRAQERAMAVQIAGIAVGALTGGAGGILGSMLGGAAAGATSTFMQQGGQYNQQGSDAAQPRTPANSPAGFAPTGIGPAGPMTPTGAPAQGPTGGPPMGGGGGEMGSMGAPAPGAMGQQQGGQQKTGPGGQKQVAGQPGQGSAGASGMGAPAVGLDGNFSPQAYAVRGVSNLQHPIQQLALTRIAADAYENDPVLRGFSVAVDQRLAARYQGAA